MTKSNKWVIGGIVVGAIALTALVLRKKTLANTGPSYVPSKQPEPTPATGNSGGVLGPVNTGPVGKNAYVGQPGLIVRGSPNASDPLWGIFGGNNLGEVHGVGTWLGVVQSTASDKDGEKNPSTNKPYVWYQLKINPALLLLPGNQYYTREDYTNLK